MVMELLVGLLKIKAPEVWVKFPETVIDPVAILVPVPLMVILLKLLALILLVPEPLKITLLELGVKVPLFVQFPLTVKVFEPVIVSDAPEFIVMLLQTAVAPITG